MTSDVPKSFILENSLMKHNPPTNPAKIGSGYGAVYLTIQANCLDQADYEEVAQTLAADIRSNRNKKENTK